MEAAVCFSGQVRTLQQTIASLRRELLGRFESVHVLAVVASPHEAAQVEALLAPRVLLVRAPAGESRGWPLRRVQAAVS